MYAERLNTVASIWGTPWVSDTVRSPNHNGGGKRMTTSGQVTGSKLRVKLVDGSLAGTWILDPARSAVKLRSRSMWGLVSVKGFFGDVSGEGFVSPAGDVNGTVTIGAASIDTKMPKRDTHLRSADFFDSDVYPQIVFKVHRVTLSGEGATVAGTLQVRDRTQPITFPATVSVSGDEVVLDAEVVINRSDFGLSWNQLGMASMKNTITVRAVFTKR